MKRFTSLMLALIVIFALASCGEKREKKESSETAAAVTKETGETTAPAEQTEPTAPTEESVPEDTQAQYPKNDFDTSAEGYDPYAMVDYDQPLVDAVSEADVHIPKINVYLEGAYTLSDKILTDHKDHVGSNAKVSYEYEVQYDVVQITVKTEKDGKTSYKVYYYDALTDTEIGVVDFISYCSIAYKALAEAVETAMGGTEFDEDDIEYIVYFGNDEYDVYVSDSIYRVTVEKTEIDTSEIMNSIEAEND